MNAPVWNPRALRTSASVTCSGPRKKPPLSRAPCSGGYRPVKMLAWAGSVSGAVVPAWSNRTPSRASASIAGVFTSVEP
jgi:hypothetical protein